MAKIKYSGDLAVHIPAYSALAAAIVGDDNWLEAEHAYRLFLLLDHYKIDRKSPSCWLELSLALATDHVPGFQVAKKPPVKRGRPKKNKNTLAELVEQCQPRKRGRPSTRTADDCQRLINFIEENKQEIRSTQGGGRVTDKAALQYIITRIARERGESVNRAISQHLAFYQKQLSNCRRKIPEIKKK